MRIDINYSEATLKASKHPDSRCISPRNSPTICSVSVHNGLVANLGFPLSQVKDCASPPTNPVTSGFIYCTVTVKSTELVWILHSQVSCLRHLSHLNRSLPNPVLQKLRRHQPVPPWSSCHHDHIQEILSRRNNGNSIRSIRTTCPHTIQRPSQQAALHNFLRWKKTPSHCQWSGNGGT